MDEGSIPSASTNLEGKMKVKVGDKIKIFSARDDSYEVGTVVEILEESIKYKREGIGGHFITLKSRCALLFCEACGCDPCDCHWGTH